MKKKIIRNAKIVTATEEFTGCLVLEGGLIRAIDRGHTSVTGAEDWADDWLLPGLVELHTDNLEKHLVPRPGGVVECALRHRYARCAVHRSRHHDRSGLGDDRRYGSGR